MLQAAFRNIGNNEVRFFQTVSLLARAEDLGFIFPAGKSPRVSSQGNNTVVLLQEREGVCVTQTKPALQTGHAPPPPSPLPPPSLLSLRETGNPEIDMYQKT